MLIFVTSNWSCLPLAILAARQGETVVATQLDPKDDTLPYIGHGLVDVVSLDDALRQHRYRDAVWAFDTNELWKVADGLSRAGEIVIGTSPLSYRLEHDRAFAATIARELGFLLPLTKEFTSRDEALKWLEKYKDRSFVYKPNEGDPSATFVPRTDDPSETIQYVSALPPREKVSFVLQEKVVGVEANFDMWMRNGEPIVGFLDLESKRAMTSDLGPLCGCAGDLVTRVSLTCLGMRQTVGRYLNWRAADSYTGSIDANIILTNKGPVFLENCWRFGYNAYVAIFAELAKAPIEYVLRLWARGIDRIEYLFRQGYAASLTVFAEYKEDTPVWGPMLPLAAHAEKGTWISVANNREIGVTTGSSAESPAAASSEAERNAAQVVAPNSWYRTDLSRDDQLYLPLRRLTMLQTAGWLR